LKPYDNPFWDLNKPVRRTTRRVGVLAPGSAHNRPSTQPPIDTSGTFLAHMFGWGRGKQIETISDKFSRHFRRFEALFRSSDKKTKKMKPMGQGVAPNFFLPQIYFFVT
jgi:hypothetical protein